MMKRRNHEPVEGDAADPLDGLTPRDLSRMFEPPEWLRDLGFLSWFLVGLGIVLVGAIFLLAATSSIVMPVVSGIIVAAVASPLVAALQARGVPRAAGAALVLLLLLAVAGVVAVLVLAGIVDNADAIRAAAADALDKVAGWAGDAGADSTGDAENAVSSGVGDAGATLMQGIAGGIQGLTSAALFLSFTLFSTFFLLKDGPAVRRFVDRHLGVPVFV